jgi:predicted RNA-binding protein with PIN domain
VFVDRLIVDGYNIIYAWPELAAIKDVSLEDAREALIGILADYAALSRLQVTVVFDSHRRPDAAGSSETISGVHVVYSGRKTSADSVIERLIYEAKSADEVTVATSDGVQRDLALGKGVKTMSALTFKGQVEAAMSRRDAQMRDRRDRSDLSRRLEDRLDQRTRERLDRLRGRRPPDQTTG